MDVAQEPAGGWQPPCKRISDRRDLATWACSPARADLLAFVTSLAVAVRGVSLRAPVHESAAVVAVVNLLATLEARRLLLCRSPGRAHAPHRPG